MDTRRVVLVRHGKAESGEEGSDHDRTLTSAGRRDAAAAGQWLAERLERVDRVWVSSAVRAQQTWAAMVDLLPDAGTVDSDRALYQAGPGEVADWVTSTDVPVAVVVGHNPTMEQTLAALTGERHDLRAGAAAVVEVAGATGRLLELFEPRH